MALRNKVTHAGKERFFICLHCSTTLSPDFTCTYCGGWNIVPVAVGTESIAEAVAHIVEKENIITIDDDLSPDSKTIESLLQTIEAKKFSVIIGTQKALPYIKRIHYAIIPFFDRLLSIPSLYTTETLLRLIMECNERVTEGVVICTKTPKFPFIQHLETKKIGTIVTEELELRRQLGYPPFGTLLKIMITVPENKAPETIQQVQSYFESLDHTMLPIRRLKETTSKVLISWLVKVTNDYLEEEGSGLTQFFESLRFPYIIERNPERL
jgi:primosomal protein N' (replication factor Y)